MADIKPDNPHSKTGMSRRKFLLSVGAAIGTAALGSKGIGDLARLSSQEIVAPHQNKIDFLFKDESINMEDYFKKTLDIVENLNEGREKLDSNTASISVVFSSRNPPTTQTHIFINREGLEIATGCAPLLSHLQENIDKEESTQLVSTRNDNYQTIKAAVDWLRENWSNEYNSLEINNHTLGLGKDQVTSEEKKQEFYQGFKKGCPNREFPEDSYFQQRRTLSIGNSNPLKNASQLATGMGIIEKSYFIHNNLYFPYKEEPGFSVLQASIQSTKFKTLSKRESGVFWQLNAALPLVKIEGNIPDLQDRKTYLEEHGKEIEKTLTSALNKPQLRPIKIPSEPL